MGLSPGADAAFKTADHQWRQGRVAGDYSEGLYIGRVIRL